MAYPKSVKIIKKIIEDTCQRRRRTPFPQPLDNHITSVEIEFCMDAMSALIQDPKLYIIADSTRFAHDFAQVMGKPYCHLLEPRHFHGLEPECVVILHTGNRTANQQANFEALQLELLHRPNIEVWHIGEWR